MLSCRSARAVLNGLIRYFEVGICFFLFALSGRVFRIGSFFSLECICEENQYDYYGYNSTGKGYGEN